MERLGTRLTFVMMGLAGLIVTGVGVIIALLLGIRPG